MKAKIERNIPIPPHGNAERGRYPFGQMRVGDSFFTPGARSSAASGASQFAKRHPGYRFITRIEGKGVRVWCIAVPNNTVTRLPSRVGDAAR
jgi:hypothetical protein